MTLFRCLCRDPYPPWFQIFAVGLVLLYPSRRRSCYQIPTTYPPCPVGAFLVPVTFVTYLYERLPQWEGRCPFGCLLLWGGALGTIVAGSLDTTCCVT